VRQSGKELAEIIANLENKADADARP